MRGRRRGVIRPQPRPSPGPGKVIKRPQPAVAAQPRPGPGPGKVIKRPQPAVAAQPSRAVDERVLPTYIDADTFRAMTRHQLPLFVRFSSPWCGHSKAMDPAWNRLRGDFPMVVASIDCTQSPSLCQECQVSGYPTMRLYNAGRPGYVEYTGGRSHNELRVWLGRALQRAG